MAKSKTRKTRRSGPHRNLQQLATSRAGKNFARMVCERATEGTDHLISIELSEGSASTPVHYDGANAVVENEEVSDFIISTLASLATAGITLETYTDVPGEKYVRAWLVDAGMFYPALADEAREAAAKSAEAKGLPVEDSKLVHFEDAFKLT